jgi:lipid A 3-O-deacylase PagL
MSPTLRWLAAAALACPALALEAQTPAPEESDRSPRWSLSGGYGFSVQLSRGRAEEQAFVFVPAVSFPLSARLEWTVEGHLAGYFRPDGYMLGWRPLGARFFFGGGRAQPYASLGAGFGWTDLAGLEEIDRRFNYLLQASIGVRRRLPDGSAWTLEARMDHISNAGTVLPNLGLNTLVFLGGWRFR